MMAGQVGPGNAEQYWPWFRGIVMMVVEAFNHA